MLQKISDLHAGQLSQEYRHTLIIFNAYCSYAAITVTRTRLIVTLCILCPSRCIIQTNCCIYTVHAETVSSLYYPRHLYTRGHQNLKNCSLSDTEYVWVMCMVTALFQSICSMRDDSMHEFFPPLYEPSHFCVCVKLYTCLQQWSSALYC